VSWWLYPAVLTLVLCAYLGGRWVGQRVGYQRGREWGRLEAMVTGPMPVEKTQPQHGPRP
jgi:hypothetical protein